MAVIISKNVLQATKKIEIAADIIRQRKWTRINSYSKKFVSRIIYTLMLGSLLGFLAYTLGWWFFRHKIHKNVERVQIIRKDFYSGRSEKFQSAAPQKKTDGTLDEKKELNLSSNEKAEIKDNSYLQMGTASPEKGFEPPKDTFFCNRSNGRTDFCVMEGDIRLHQRLNFLILVSDTLNTSRKLEKIKPYPRKGDHLAMGSLWQFILRSVNSSEISNLKETSERESENLRKKESSLSSDRTEFSISSNIETVKESREKLTDSVSFGDGYESKIMVESSKKEKIFTRNYLTDESGQWREDKMVTEMKHKLGTAGYWQKIATESGTFLDEEGKSIYPEGNWFTFPKPRNGEPWPGEANLPNLDCDIRHKVPVIVFSTGGYTGNVYHDFADVLVPLYITAQPYYGEVVLAIAEFHYSWLQRYGAFISVLSNYPPLLLGISKEVHCFPKAVVGLDAHEEYVIDPNRMSDRVSLQDFQLMFNRAFEKEPIPETDYFPFEPRLVDYPPRSKCDPILTILVRHGSRELLNQVSVIRWAQESGYSVRLLHPLPETPMLAIWRALQETDVLMAVHGAACTHFIFMRPGTVFLQMVPMALPWPAATYYGEPSKALGLKYIGYDIEVNESSLVDYYPPDDPVLVDPMSFWEKGYDTIRRTFMEKQQIRLLEPNVRRLLRHARDLWLRGPFGNLFFSNETMECIES